MKKLASLAAVLILLSCQQEAALVENQAVGYAQGTTYQVKYITPKAEDWKPAFDSIFKVIDQSMSTYRGSSLISAINKGDTLVAVDSLFLQVLEKSLEVARETNGLFDPTVGPLVAHWGFGPKDDGKINEGELAEVRKHIGYEKIRQQGNKVGLPEGFQLDFNAIAQGFTVDVVSSFLQKKGVNRYMVEVGGEVKAKGQNINGQMWRIGIDKPTEEIDQQNRFQLIVSLKDRALATSGNYRKFWVDDETGLRYAHTIDPLTGRPAKNQLLSVTIIAKSCMDADAYATACMVMGSEKALRFVRSKPGLEGYFISSGENGEWEVKQTKGFADFVP